MKNRLYQNIHSVLNEANAPTKPTANPKYVENPNGSLARHFNTWFGPLNFQVMNKTVPPVKGGAYANALNQPKFRPTNAPESFATPSPLGLPPATAAPRPMASPTPLPTWKPTPLPTYSNQPRATATPKVNVNQFLDALGKQESGGNYAARNKTSGAIGKYQIMPNNWSGWAQEAGLAPNAATTPANQDRVAQFQINKLYNKYGNWGDVASVWYSGQPQARANLNKSQGAYPTIKTYVNSVLGRLGM